MSDLPIPIHSAAQVRAMDAYAIDRLGIPGYTLMSRAGTAALQVLRECWPRAKRIVIVCGSGNNAGDGYVLARLARQAGMKITVIALFSPKQLTGDAAQAWQDFTAAGGQAIDWLDSVIAQADVIVDAIFGTGLSRPLDDALCARVRTINAAAAGRFALDIPSGLNADTGLLMGEAIRATCTLTFVGLKLGFYLGAGPDYVGTLKFAALGIPDIDAQIGFDAERLDAAWLTRNLPARSRLAHKGSNGHVLLVAGNSSMAGAARLAGEACLRVGAGLVTVATRAENVSAIVSERPELIVRAVTGANELAPLLSRADVVAVGPGLGQDSWSSALVDAVFASDRPLVVDADALNLLAATPRERGNWVLTPHPGEAGRLLQIATADIQAKRLACVRELSNRFGGVVILKGAHSLICTGNAAPQVCEHGNPAMATPGMGDVLTGVIAGLAAQFGDLWAAARAGVLAHAVAGDQAAAALGPHVERGLIASDLFTQLPSVVSRRD